MIVSCSVLSCLVQPIVRNDETAGLSLFQLDYDPDGLSVRVIRVPTNPMYAGIANLSKTCRDGITFPTVTVSFESCCDSSEVLPAGTAGMARVRGFRDSATGRTTSDTGRGKPNSEPYWK